MAINRNSKELFDKSQSWFKGFPNKKEARMQLSLEHLIPVTSLYLGLTNTRRRILQYLRFQHVKNKGNVYPSIKKIAQFAKCSERAVKDFYKFNEELGNFFFKKEKRKNEFGRQRSNAYHMNKDLIQAMEWLSLHGFLNANRKKKNKIVSSMQNTSKLHSEPIRQLHPLTKDLSYKDESKSTPPNPQECQNFVHPKIQKIGIAQEAKEMLSKYPEFAIEAGLRDVLWYKDRRTISDPVEILRIRMAFYAERGHA